MLVPGISGGSIAIILDIYDELLIRLNNIFTNFKNNFKYLTIVTIGGVIGMVISSFILDFFIKTIYFELIYLFLGVVTVYLFDTFKKTNKYNLFLKLLFIFIGFGIGLLITMIPQNYINFKNEYLTLFILGIFLAVALILPGISVSYVLLIFGLYSEVIFSIKTFNYLYLLKLGLFLIIGIILVIKVLYYFIITKKEIVENIIGGFILSSIWIIIPKISNYNELIYAFIFIFSGILLRKMVRN